MSRPRSGNKDPVSTDQRRVRRFQLCWPAGNPGCETGCAGLRVVGSLLRRLSLRVERDVGEASLSFLFGLLAVFVRVLGTPLLP